MSLYHETVLVVEDDVQIRNFISYALTAEGFQCVTAGNGQTALRRLISDQPDLMLLDLGLPDVDGMDVLKRVREWSELPIIIVSARDQDKEKAAALDAGADDYLTKPFSATELMARIRVALRHLYRQGAPKTQTMYQVGELTLDVEKHQATLEGNELHLTPMEFQMMTLFMKNAGKVLTSAFLLKEVWGVDYGTDTQALRALMAGLRRKVEKNPAKPRYLKTEIGVGYRMADE